MKYTVKALKHTSDKHANIPSAEEAGEEAVKESNS